MDISGEILARKRPVFDKAAAFGFVPVSGDNNAVHENAAHEELVYREEILDGELTAEVFIKSDGTVKCRVIDTDTGDEYNPLNIEAYTGQYVGSVREAFREFLKRIADSCFEDVPFASDQANRIAIAIEQEFSARPEHPFRKDRGAVFRHSSTGRWFAIDLNVERGKIDDLNSDGSGAGEDELIDVMNVKIDPEKLDGLLKEPGICRCYHMNKKLWATLTMDDRLTDQRIMELIRRSYTLTTGSSIPISSRRPAGGRSYWIIPSNPKNYNVAEGFRKSRDHIIPWHHRINVQPGDIVYIYQTEPVAAIIFRCEVVNSFLPRPSSWSWLAPSSKYRMDLRLLQTFDKNMYPRKWMNEHGIKKTVRGQRSAPPELVREIEKTK